MMDADPYIECEVYLEHGACVCSTGYPALCTVVEKREITQQMVDANSNNPRPVPRPIPTPVKPGKPTTYDIAKAYLASLHCTLWPSEAWYIYDENGQDAAATWITKMVDEINAIRNMVAGSTNMTVQQAAEDYRRMTEDGLI